jgi:hypothetical protein
MGKGNAVGIVHDRLGTDVAAENEIGRIGHVPEGIDGVLVDYRSAEGRGLAGGIFAGKRRITFLRAGLARLATGLRNRNTPLQAHQQCQSRPELIYRGPFHLQEHVFR